MNKTSSRQWISHEDLKVHQACFLISLQKRQLLECITHLNSRLKPIKDNIKWRTVKVQENRRLIDNPKEIILNIRWNLVNRFKISTKGSCINKILREIRRQSNKVLRTSQQSLLRLSTICTVMLTKSETRLNTPTTHRLLSGVPDQKLQ